MNFYDLLCLSCKFLLTSNLFYNHLVISISYFNIFIGVNMANSTCSYYFLNFLNILEPKAFVNLLPHNFFVKIYKIATSFSSTFFLIKY